MTTYSKLNVIYRLQKWMDSVPGQTFLNYAYSWGASVVILGTLFKLTHLPGANFFLFLGMGTEVFVFFISAFDRPFDKTTDGMDLDIHVGEGEDEEQPAVAVAGNGGGVVGGGTVIIGGGIVGGVVGNGEEAARWEGAPAGAAGAVVVSETPSESLPMGEELKEATSNYIDELNRLTEMLAQVSEQSQRLTRDSEEMENLNRTLTGISRVYEMQLKSASSQISTIDEINEQTRHMAEQIMELNKIYARMIEAMQVRAAI
ncbi:MAG: gliding motility protein GldL [Prevotella sp.]|nr:gliding motility protein GldL [Prevotella sp.]